MGKKPVHQKHLSSTDITDTGLPSAMHLFTFAHTAL